LKYELIQILGKILPNINKGLYQNCPFCNKRAVPLKLAEFKVINDDFA